MNIKDFKAGKYIKQIEYSSFLPAKNLKEATTLKILEQI